MPIPSPKAGFCCKAKYKPIGQGFEVLAVKDATAAAKVPEGDGYAAGR